jgi:hypothetical protein
MQSGLYTVPYTLRICMEQPLGGMGRVQAANSCRARLGTAPFGTGVTCAGSESLRYVGNDMALVLVVPAQGLWAAAEHHLPLTCAYATRGLLVSGFLRLAWLLCGLMRTLVI